MGDTTTAFVTSYTPQEPTRDVDHGGDADNGDVDDVVHLVLVLRGELVVDRQDVELGPDGKNANNNGSDMVQAWFRYGMQDIETRSQK